ncbi:hypothetical protein PTSG_01849 [Salpingoeca rosetta]|uniref:Large ribosomal subunit protein mL52 n=1 Tax=Salpingoeca rosetta (strain ATCC 50818 / BSB-021) TaxID=946362 RepID=F2TZ48_SALR5|nr:uncharacterized protein PTSG_01849 [Salpingoeca rosetta]EGD78872.1 hypothetical protein PTSG_01849 [Salpingoeca rosetta]|eukprot:XP_004997828.1 hypothetical protein PTSG_01849 [Salpingoeca rosetta]
MMHALARAVVWQRAVAASSAAVVRPVTRASLHTASPCAAGEKSRLKRGKGRSGNEFGPLTDLPDWSYADGDQAPAPMTAAQLKRKRDAQRRQARVSQLLKDISVASKPARK